MFQPKTEYDVIRESMYVKDFHEYKEDFVTRPPYQRKIAWSRAKQQALLDSLFRRYYVPSLVLREVRLSDELVLKEVVDGQQRITTVQLFFADALPLPKSLDSVRDDLPGKTYSKLPVDVRKFVDKHLKFDVDIIKNVDNPKSPEHQNIATEIFWRLQQGESLNFMEIAHARLSSPVRNFITKYADDIGFDYDSYKPLDENRDKHPFFDVIERKNDRMQHLSLLARLLLIERAKGPTDIRDKLIAEWIDETQQDSGIGDESFENDPVASSLLQTLNTLHQVFKDDPVLDDESGIRELSTEYFIISIVMLMMHLRRYYAILPEHHGLFRDFVYDFHRRWKGNDESDHDVQSFSSNRQQSASDLELRDRIMRQLFFEFAQKQGVGLKTRDTKRLFDEGQRIAIYRRDKGLCQACLAEDKPEKEATVSWSQYQADHIIPWMKGGQTVEENAQVLCSYHNASKGAK